MNNRAAPRLSKWAFLAGDLLLLVVAGWIVYRQPHDLNVAQVALAVAAVALGAWIATAPFIMEYRAALRFAEADELVSAVSQIQKLQLVGEQIRLATSQWQTVQEHSGKTVTAAKEIADRMVTEAKNFTEFMQKANDSEKAHLRLEVEKARRSESEWLQILVRLLDHVYALHQAGVHSRQPGLRQQLGHFQTACREIARRVGLVPIEAAPEEPYDEMKHQLAEDKGPPPAGALIAETVATGYTFQGQLLRPPIVLLKTSETAPGSDADSAADGQTSVAPEASPSEPPSAPPATSAEADPQMELGHG